jgi:hypothetical protein
MGPFTPAIGAIVSYRLTSDDANAINTRRADFAAFQRSHAHPHEPGQPGATGHQAHVGNTVGEGEVLPAIVVAKFPGNPDGLVNLKVFLDGNDDYWATSRKPGDEPGQWFFATHIDEGGAA